MIPGDLYLPSQQHHNTAPPSGCSYISDEDCISPMVYEYVFKELVSRHPLSLFLVSGSVIIFLLFLRMLKSKEGKADEAYSYTGGVWRSLGDEGPGY